MLHCCTAVRSAGEDADIYLLHRPARGCVRSISFPHALLPVDQPLKMVGIRPNPNPNPDRLGKFSECSRNAPVTRSLCSFSIVLSERVQAVNASAREGQCHHSTTPPRIIFILIYFGIYLVLLFASCLLRTPKTEIFKTDQQPARKELPVHYIAVSIYKKLSFNHSNGRTHS